MRKGNTISPTKPTTPQHHAQSSCHNLQGSSPGHRHTTKKPHWNELYNKYSDERHEQSRYTHECANDKSRLRRPTIPIWGIDINYQRKPRKLDSFIIITANYYILTNHAFTTTQIHSPKSMMIPFKRPRDHNTTEKSPKAHSATSRPRNPGHHRFHDQHIHPYVLWPETITRSQIK